MDYDTKHLELNKNMPTFALDNQQSDYDYDNERELKPVTISGMTGILMGAGTMFASQKLTTDAQPVDVESNEQPLQEASVEGCQSFREAFLLPGPN